MALLLSLILLLSHANAQELQHSDIADGRPDQIVEGSYQSYATALGFTLEVGDTLTLSVPQGVSAQATVHASSAAVTSTAVASGWYTTVYNGTQSATMAKAVLAGLSGATDPALYMAPQSLAGTQVRVTKITLAGSKKRPYVWAECEFVNAVERKNASGVITIGDVDRALRLGEVTSEKHITREMAIEKLKESKELFDIGVYTQEQLDADKAKYMPYLTP